MRHDEHYLQLIHRHIGLRVFSEIQNLPFFYLEMPDKWMISPTQADLRIIKEMLPLEEISLENLLPFPEFSFVLANDPSLHVVKILKDEKGGKALAMSDYFLPKSYDYSGSGVSKNVIGYGHDITVSQKKHIDKGIWIHFHLRQPTGDYGCIIQQMYRRKAKMKTNLRDHIDASPEAKIVYERNKQDMESLMLSIIALFYSAEERHEYLVRVTKNLKYGSNQRGKHHSSKYAATHHYIYLDKPPAITLSKSEATGIKKRGHARRAHWHRLMHKRFKNHPQFGQRIRIKASWIGPKEWADSGKIYTLHEPDEL